MLALIKELRRSKKKKKNELKITEVIQFGNMRHVAQLFWDE